MVIGCLDKVDVDGVVSSHGNVNTPPISPEWDEVGLLHNVKKMTHPPLPNNVSAYLSISKTCNEMVKPSLWRRWKRKVAVFSIDLFSFYFWRVFEIRMWLRWMESEEGFWVMNNVEYGRWRLLLLLKIMVEKERWWWLCWCLKRRRKNYFNGDLFMYVVIWTRWLWGYVMGEEKGLRKMVEKVMLENFIMWEVRWVNKGEDGDEGWELLRCLLHYHNEVEYLVFGFCRKLPQ